MHLYNTLTRKVEQFTNLAKPASHVSLYCCGPTVYDFTHIGHLRKYTMDDVLRRALTYTGYEVKHVMNITDVGHLVSDGDTGEDKMETGAKKYGKTVWEVAQMYTDFFTRSMKEMNVLMPTVVCKATDHIPGMIKMIEQLEKNGYTYQTGEAVYFDTSKFNEYEELSGQKQDEKKSAVRAEVVEDTNKKSPADFALWFLRVGKFADHAMHWDSPWGDGFPGWHIECSAMSREYLGDQIDIHTGGIDHVPVHHTNEIAQSEAATGKHPFVKYWVHHNFLTVEGTKMSKSLGKFLTIDDIVEKGVDPMALRLLFLQTHYRNEMNFTWVALEAAQTAYTRFIRRLREVGEADPTLDTEFATAIDNDLDTSVALSVLLKVKNPDQAFKMDRVLGLGIQSTLTIVEEIPADIVELTQKRFVAKQQKDYATADSIRVQIESKGYKLLDTKEGSRAVKGRN
ncbi:MAG: cysteine--tRNA ligase [bacterium]